MITSRLSLISGINTSVRPNIAARCIIYLLTTDGIELKELRTVKWEDIAAGRSNNQRGIGWSASRQQGYHGHCIHLRDTHKKWTKLDHKIEQHRMWTRSQYVMAPPWSSQHQHRSQISMRHREINENAFVDEPSTRSLPITAPTSDRDLELQPQDPRRDEKANVTQD